VPRFRSIGLLTIGPLFRRAIDFNAKSHSNEGTLNQDGKEAEAEDPFKFSSQVLKEWDVWDRLSKGGACLKFAPWQLAFSCCFNQLPQLAGERPNDARRALLALS
jgi:hypothetical protein